MGCHSRGFRHVGFKAWNKYSAWERKFTVRVKSVVQKGLSLSVLDIYAFQLSLVYCSCLSPKPLAIFFFWCSHLLSIHCIFSALYFASFWGKQFGTPGMPWERPHLHLVTSCILGGSDSYPISNKPSVNASKKHSTRIEIKPEIQYSQMLKRCKCVHLSKTSYPNCNCVSKQEISFHSCLMSLVMLTKLHWN